MTWGLSDDELEALVRRDGIDVLVTCAATWPTTGCACSPEGRHPCRRAGWATRPPTAFPASITG